MNIIFDLFPMILGTVLAPVWIIIVLLVLRSPNGLVKAIAFIVGITIVRLLQGLLFGYILSGIDSAGASGELSPVILIVLVVLGILLLISAIKTLMHEPDPDAPPPKWMKKLDQATAPALLGMGILFTLVAPKLWIFTLSAIGVIRSANLSPTESLTAFLTYVVGAQSLIMLPVLLYAIAPRQSASLLQSVSDWLMRYNSQITLVVSFVFGSLFLWKGISGLVA